MFRVFYNLCKKSYYCPSTGFVRLILCKLILFYMFCVVVVSADAVASVCVMFDKYHLRGDYNTI